MADEEWDLGTIFTSPTSKTILLLRFPHLAPYVKALELHTPHTIRGRTVTLYEANHCPGAVMFLFQGPSPAAVQAAR
jgi:DNA cross-link repair 1A protein